MKHQSIFLLFLTVWAPALIYSATLGDFRTKASGNWNQINTWQYYNGSAWVNATYTPTYADDDIDVLSGHAVTLTANVTIDQASIAGSLQVNSGVILTINDGSSTDMTISGVVNVYGTLINKGSITSSVSELYFYNGSLYQHNKDGGTIPNSTWNDGSTCEINGILTSTSLGGAELSFYHFKWNCPSQTAETNLAGNLETIRGNLIVVTTGSGRMKLAETADYFLTIYGDWIHQNGTLNMGGGSSYSYITLKGNLTMNAGKITEGNSSGYTSSITFAKTGTQIVNKTGGTFENTIDFILNNGTTLDLGESVIDGSNGTFSVNGGGTLKTSHLNGIASSGASGCIQTTGRYFSPGANYHYARNGSQNTGNGLPGTLTGKLMIGTATTATNLALTNGTVTISNWLILCSSNLANSSITSGTVSYGSSAVLEYQGMSAQSTTVKEWPVNSGPVNVTANNPYGVALTDNRTVTGTFSLASGIFTIGSYALTLNGTLVVTTGSLSGGCTSVINIGGSSAGALDLPGVTLATLSVNRPGGVRLMGNISICTSVILSQGAVILMPGKALSYQPGSRLIYNGTATQNTAAEEFPATNGPPSLEINKPAGTTLNLMFSRTLSNNLYLNGGLFSIGSNTLTLEGMITPGAGNICGGSSSNLVVSGGASTFSLPGITLGTLTLQRNSGLNLAGEVLICNALVLNNGTCSINGFNLRISGALQYYGGLLAGGPTSSMEVNGSSPPLSLHPITLHQLFIDRPSGVVLAGDIEVQHLLLLSQGGITRNGFQLYGPLTTLRYQGTTIQTTTDEELPQTNGPLNLSVYNPTQLILHADRTIPGNIELINGQLVIGNHTLTLNGNFFQGAGVLTGGLNAGITFNPGVLPGFLPSVEVGSLVINRTAGVTTNGNCTVYGTLQLTDGDFTVGMNQTLMLNGTQIAGDPLNLKTGSTSGLFIAGSTPEFVIPSSISQLGVLTVMNTNGAVITSDIQISNALQVNGKLIMYDHTLNGNGMVRIMPGSVMVCGHQQGIMGNIQMSGPQMVDGNVNYEFNGESDQMTGFLPTIPPNTIRNLMIRNCLPSVVFMDTNLYVGGTVEILEDASLNILPGVVVEVNGEVVLD